MIKRKKTFKALEWKNKDSHLQRKNIRLIDFLLETMQIKRLERLESDVTGMEAGEMPWSLPLKF